jgi:hypothetical protein
MKRNIIYIGLIVVFIALAGLFFRNQKNEPVIFAPSPTAEVKKTVVTLVLNDGDAIASYSGIAAQNAFEALRVVATKENIPLVTKQYDFGIFVQKVGEKESGNVMSWIYFINGKSGDVAGDKATLKSGDIVEWNYTKAMY